MVHESVLGEERKKDMMQLYYNLKTKRTNNKKTKSKKKHKSIDCAMLSRPNINIDLRR